MSKAKTAKPDAPASGVGQHIITRLRISAFILIAPLSFYLLICLFSYDPSDPGWSNAGQSDQVHNAGGLLGAWVADIALILFGYLAWLFPLILLYGGFLIVRERKAALASKAEKFILLGGFIIALLAGTALSQIHFNAQAAGLPEGGGGILGQFISGLTLSGMGVTGATLLLLSLFLAGLTLFTGLSWIGLMDRIGALVMRLLGGLGQLGERFAQWRQGRHARKARVEVRKADTARRKTHIPPRIQQAPAKPERSSRKAKEVQMPLFNSIPAGSLPPLSLLDDPPEQKSGYSAETLEALARQVELKLADFKVQAEVVEVVPGPVVTRFELQPAPGVKGSQIINLAKDLARGLSVTSVRVVDVIPGKSVIGLEIPNTNREIVYLSQIIQSKAYDDARSPLTLGLGKDISGKPIVANLGKMPHLLVAGTTGSGKSVAVNAMILSILYKATPDQVRLIMIDPKMLELSIYEDIPHLLAPVVTDMKEAANALRWCVAEMERRYKLMAAMGVRNLAGFNRKVSEAAKAGAPLKDPLFQKPEFSELEVEVPELETLPFVVVVIDEFADMMMIVGKKVEELITRLAQKARASGIHLILATQRPSVDVITGLIKANVPARIAFQVSSRIDSRTILDQMGADQLLGHGDMLFLPPGTSTPERVHGAFVDDHEVHNVVNYLKQHAEPNYLEAVLNDNQVTSDGVSIGDNGLPDASDEVDELYDKAVFIVTKSRKASISSVQRQLRIGYNRAARLVEEMEAQGVVTPAEHNGSREVLAPPPPDA